MTVTGADPVVRWLVAVEPDGAFDDDARLAFEQWATEVAAGNPDLVGVETEVVSPPEHAAFTGEEDSPRWCAFLSLWSTSPLDPGSMGAPEGAVVHPLRLRDRLRHDFPSDMAPGRRVPGFKKTTLWRSSPDCADWRERYAGHGEVVLRCHRSAWRYRQNLVVEDPSGLGFDAVSELWWATAPALIERFYASDEARAAVKADVVFVHRPDTVQVVTVHTVVVPPPRPPGVPRWLPEW